MRLQPGRGAGVGWQMMLQAESGTCGSRCGCSVEEVASRRQAGLSPPEHTIGVFVLFWPLKPPFSCISSTKSRFLCFFALRNPRFQAFRAQNRHFCARADGDTASVRVHWRVSIRNRGDDHRLRAFRAQNRAALPTGSLFPMVCTGTGEEIRPHMWRQ